MILNFKRKVIVFTALNLILVSFGFAGSFTKGLEQDQTYDYPISNKTVGHFSVKNPLSLTEPGTKMVFGKEILDNQTTVTFSSNGPDASVFRASVAVKNALPFEVLREVSLPLVLQKISSYYHAPLSTLYETNTTFAGHKAIHAIYSQSISDYVDGATGREIKAARLTHSIYFVDYGKYSVILWSMGNNRSAVDSLDKRDLQLLIENKWLPEHYFLDSFKIS